MSFFGGVAVDELDHLSLRAAEVSGCVRDAEGVIPTR